jgi:hypothetical protein
MTPQQEIAMAASIDRTIATIRAWRARHHTPEDRAILERLPVVAQATYLQADRADVMHTSQRLRCIGSIALSVAIEISTDLQAELREVRRAVAR